VKIGKKDKEIEVPQAIDVIREIDGRCFLIQIVLRDFLTLMTTQITYSSVWNSPLRMNFSAN